MGIGRSCGCGQHRGADRGRLAQSVTSNQQDQQEAVAATQLATSIMPAIFAFAALFAKK